MANSSAYEAIVRAGPRLNQLQQVHAHLIVTGYGHSRSLLTKLITFACSAKALAYTHLLFLSVPLPDDFLFNTIIKSTSKSRLPLDCLAYYRRMLSSSNVSPSNYTFTSVIKSSADHELLAATKINVKHIKILVLNCGVLNTTPSLSAMVINHYKLRHNTESYNLGGSYALAVSTEIVSFTWYSGNDATLFPPNCSFRMGAAAVMLSSRRDR
ncbi:hypothetical protein Bca52824_028719 [Brassica carinata]|uniref:FAE domain-containing protein n=1 Tax=Brassica carinata TaxID=52824 RepID=A0A8X7VCQ3_BRACI|nr:hypothetical protein Bca52824_028719 [Brassica carinata]